MDKGIEDETPMDELEAELAQAHDYQDRIVTYKAHASRLIQKAGESVSMLASDPSSVRSRYKQTVKLPKLVIEILSEETSWWQEFWSQYETAIHNNDAVRGRGLLT